MKRPKKIKNLVKSFNRYSTFDGTYATFGDLKSLRSSTAKAELKEKAEEETQIVINEKVCVFNFYLKSIEKLKK